MTRSFGDLWDRHVEIDLATTDPVLCQYAVRFNLWAVQLTEGVLTRPTLVGLNQSKVLLLDKYFDWRRSVPKAHRGVPTGDRAHLCLFHVLEDTYEQLRVAELEITPPMLFVPAPPPPPPSRQIGGIFIGDAEED